MLCAVQVQSILAEGLQVSSRCRSMGCRPEFQELRLQRAHRGTASSPSSIPTVARMGGADGEHKVTREASTMAQTGVCAPDSPPRPHLRFPGRINFDEPRPDRARGPPRRRRAGASTPRRRRRAAALPGGIAGLRGAVGRLHHPLRFKGKSYRVKHALM